MPLACDPSDRVSPEQLLARARAVVHKGPMSVLEDYKESVFLLREKGLSFDRIAAWSCAQGTKVSSTTVMKFLQRNSSGWNASGCDSLLLQERRSRDRSQCDCRADVGTMAVLQRRS